MLLNNYFGKFLIVHTENLSLTNLNETLLELLSILVFRYPITKAHSVQNDQNIFMENWYT